MKHSVMLLLELTSNPQLTSQGQLSPSARHTASSTWMEFGRGIP